MLLRLNEVIRVRFWPSRTWVLIGRGRNIRDLCLFSLPCGDTVRREPSESWELNRVTLWYWTSQSLELWESSVYCLSVPVCAILLWQPELANLATSAQLVKNPPAMLETWVRSLGWEDSPGEGNGYPLQYSGLENSMDMWHVVAKSQTRLSDFHYYYTNSSKLSWLLILFFHLNFTSLYFYQNCLVVWFWQLLF